MKVVLADCPVGAIIFTDNRWGVVCRARSAQDRDWRIVDFWGGGRERVRSWKIVEMQV